MAYIVDTLFALAALLVGGGVLLLALSAAFFVQFLDKVFGLPRVQPKDQPVQAELDPDDEMPQSLADWIARESESWARDELRRQAYLMRRSGWTWERIQQTFGHVHGKTTGDPEAAADEAWDKAGKELST